MARIVLQMENDDIIRMKRFVLKEKGSQHKQSEFLKEIIMAAIAEKEAALA